MIDFYLNKIEPVSMQAVMKINADNVVHTTRDEDVEIRTDSEGHNKQEAPEPEQEQDTSDERELTDEEVREKVIKLNAAARKADYKFYFAFNPRNRELCINVMDRKTGQVIRSFGQSEIEDMLRRLTVTSGVLIDYKR